MAFGYGKLPGLLRTREVEDQLSLVLGDVEAGEEVWLLSPYATMGRLGPLRRAIAEAAKRGAAVSFVVRDEPDQTAPAERDLEEALLHGVNLYGFHRLHAKLYWFEGRGSIVTSANLVDGSFQESTELGLWVPDGELHQELRGWIRAELEPGLRALAAGSGHCIRCGTGIDRDPKRPYCLEHYRTWSRYKDEHYAERHCHRCGGKAETSMARPLCPRCFAAGGRGRAA